MTLTAHSAEAMPAAALPKPAAPSRALVTPKGDFMLVGGLAVVTFAAFWALTGGVFKFDLENKAHFWAFYAAFVINYPHFAYSYLLFYPGFARRLTAPETTLMGKMRLATAGVLAPFAMLLFFIQAWHTQDPKYLGWATYAMTFSVGWHYCKQGYGVLITTALYRGVFYNLWEKRVLFGNAYLVWIYTFLRINNGGTQPYYDVSYTTFACPTWVLQGSLGLSAVSTAAAAGVLLNHWLRDRKGLSLTAVMGYVAAIYMWVMLPFVNMTFYVFIPLFHSLQYMPFVYKFKKTEYLRARAAPEGTPQKTARRALLKLVAFTVSGYALGALFFEFIPKFIDDKFWVFDLDPQFFLIAFLTFINVHHYFIDAAFWRRDNSDVQRNLFRA